MRVENETARFWYLNEAAKQMWSYRTLGQEYQYAILRGGFCFRKKNRLSQKCRKRRLIFKKTDRPISKSDYCGSFWDHSNTLRYTNPRLEEAITNNLQQFLMELGKGFAFVARQQHLRTEENDYFIDLVFYNYILKCFVLIDLKTNKLSYQDVGQMDMYLQLYVPIDEVT